MQVHEIFAKSSKILRNTTRNCVDFAKMLTDIFEIAESCLLFPDQRKSFKKGTEKNLNERQRI